MTRSAHPLFSLETKGDRKKMSLVLRLKTDKLYTSELSFPNFLETLKNAIPEIFWSECFNEEKLPFYREVKKTELGHLLEHIILEYLCNLKLEQGHKKPCFRGFTHWNWENEPRGTFHITIGLAKRDETIFSEALEKSLTLFQLLLGQDTTQRAEELCAAPDANTLPQRAFRPY